MKLVCTGAITESNAAKCFQMVHPLTESLGTTREVPLFPFLPHYPMTSVMLEAGLQQKVLLKVICWVLDNLKHYPQVLPQKLEQKHAFPPLNVCLRQMHTPGNPGELNTYTARIIYEELYRLAITLRWNKRQFARPVRRAMNAGTVV